MMKKLLKEYEAPLCDVVECVVEGVIATSPTYGEEGKAGATGSQYVYGGGDL